MSNQPTIAALRAALEVERNDEMTAYELCTGPVGYRNGHQAATERLMAIVEKAVEGLEYFSKLESSSNVSYDVIIGKKAREFLLSIRETVADASTLADASGESKKEQK